MRIKNIKKAIQEYFFVYPTAKLRVREMERILKLPLPSVIRYSRELVKEGFLKKIKMGNVTFFTGDRTNSIYLLEKRLFNIKQLYLSGFIEYIRHTFSNPVIVVFGSYSKGEDTESSDIDIYLQTPSKKSMNFEKFEKILSRKIQVFIFKDITKVPNKHLANNIINGIVLNNTLEVFK